MYGIEMEKRDDLLFDLFFSEAHIGRLRHLALCQFGGGGKEERRPIL